MDIQDLKNRFSYYTVDKTQEDKMKQLRMNLLNLAVLINDIAPEGREKSLAITNLETVMFWTNAAISRNGGQ